MCKCALILQKRNAYRNIIMHQPVAEIPASKPKQSPTLVWKYLRASLWILGAGALLWAIAVGYIWFKQEHLLFFPKPLSPQAKFDMAYTSEVFIEVPGAKIHALYLKQPPEQSKGIVLFLHGNAGNLETWFTNAEFWLTTGYDVLMPDYRGFGKSTGQIASEAQLHDDVLRIWEWVAPHYQHKKIVFYGRSLGTGLATRLATKVSPNLLVLVSAYSSMRQVAREQYPWVPSALLRYPLPSEDWLPQVKGDVLLIHGTADTLIPLAHSQRLQKLRPHTRLVEIPNAGHGDIHNFPLYTETLIQALKAL
jgi:uncharacterized protein